MAQSVCTTLVGRIFIMDFSEQRGLITRDVYFVMFEAVCSWAFPNTVLAGGHACTSTHAQAHMHTTCGHLHEHTSTHAHMHKQGLRSVVCIRLYIGGWGKSPVCWRACMHTCVVYVSLFCMTMFHVLCLSLLTSWWSCRTVWHCSCCGFVGQCLVFVCLMCGMVDW